MLRNCLAAALRHLARHRLQAAINIIGLAVGFTAAMLIGLYVRDELEYDRWIPGYKSVYRIALGLEFGNFTNLPSAGTAAPMAGWIKADFPQVLAAGRMQPDVRVLRHGNVQSTETVYWSDPEIFDVLPLPVLVGDPRQLAEPDGLVLTRRMARKYFGRDNPIGESLLLDGKVPLRVAAVLQDLPLTTHLTTEIFASGHNSAATLPALSTPLNLRVSFDNLAATLTYIRLRPGADSAPMERELQKKVEAHVAIPQGPSGRPLVPVPRVFMQPLSAIHFVPAGIHAMKPAGDLQALCTIAAVGLLILLVASVNFVNLMTAHATRRAREVGVRRLSGASRTQLLLQFQGESLAVVAISAVFAAAVAELLLPALSAFLGRDMTFTWWHDLQFDSAVLLATLVVGALAGVYPAFVLTGMRAAATFNTHSSDATSRPTVRAVLATLQFAVLIILLLATAVIYLQTRFAAGDGLRFDKDEVLVINSACRGAFPEAVRSLPGVRAAACTDAQFGIGGGWVGVTARADGSRPVATTFVAVDAGLLELFGLKPVSGRFFSGRQGDVTDVTGGDVRTATGGSVVINETAVREFGLLSAAAAVGRPATFLPYAGRPPTVVGVVGDFRLQGIRRPVQAAVFRVIPGADGYLMVKLQNHGMPETLAAIDGLWKRLENGRPISRRFLDAAIQAQYLDTLRQTQILAIFTVTVLFIACLGLLGLSAYIAERRTREIGIRKALGAATFDVIRLLLLQFGRPVLWANLIAWPVAAWALRHWLQGFAYHVDLSLWLFPAAGGLALAIALLTVCTHSVLVARTKPVAALRYE